MKIGDVCIKTRGRTAGKKVVVLSNPKNGRVIIEGKNVKKKECNILHLYPVGKSELKKDAKHEDIVKIIEK